MEVKKNKVAHDLEAELFSEMVRQLEHHTLSGNCTLFYEGQTPPVAFVVIDGQVILRKRQKEHCTLGSGSLFGVVELYTHRPARFEAQVCEGTKLAILDRSALNEIMMNAELASSQFLKKILERK